MNKKEIIDSLIKNGAIKTTGLSVKNVTVTPFEEHVRIGITVDKDIKAYVQNPDTGIYEEGTSNIVFSSSFALASVIKDMPEAAFAANQIVANPNSLAVILSGAKIDIITEFAASGEEYSNPWSTKTDKVTTFTHDVYINHVVNIELSQFGKDMLKQLALNMMGIR